MKIPAHQLCPFRGFAEHGEEAYAFPDVLIPPETMLPVVALVKQRQAVGANPSSMMLHQSKLRGYSFIGTAGAIPIKSFREWLAELEADGEPTAEFARIALSVVDGWQEKDPSVTGVWMLGDSVLDDETIPCVDADALQA